MRRRAVAVVTDVSKASDLDRLVATAIEEMGRVDVLVNNAAYTSGHALTQPVWEMSREDWELQFATNVHAPFSLIKAVAPHLRDQGGGVVVNITSRAYESQPVDRDASRLFGGAGPWAYGSSKAALNRMANGMAGQLFAHGIAVVTLEPGFVRTEFVDFMSERGAFDASAAISTSVPAKVVAHLAEADNALRYTGQVVLPRRRVARRARSLNPLDSAGEPTTTADRRPSGRAARAYGRRGHAGLALVERRSSAGLLARARRSTELLSRNRRHFRRQAGRRREPHFQKPRPGSVEVWNCKTEGSTDPGGLTTRVGGDPGRSKVSLGAPKSSNVQSRSDNELNRPSFDGGNSIMN